jgi:hypothetical protein
MRNGWNVSHKYSQTASHALVTVVGSKLTTYTYCAVQAFTSATYFRDSRTGKRLKAAFCMRCLWFACCSRGMEWACHFGLQVDLILQVHFRLCC